MRTAVPPTATPSRQLAFRLYVEGPRDRGLVEAWSRTRNRDLARWIARETVILGGSQPRRAAQDFERAGEERDGLRALCLLDRDQGDHDLRGCQRDGLEFHVWPRRHIESYLLVPAAIARSLRLGARDGRVSDYFAHEVPALDDEPAFRDFDAKSLFGGRGALSEQLGRPVSSGRVAKVMRADEIHRDVCSLLDRLASAAGVGGEPTTVHKPKAAIR